MMKSLPRITLAVAMACLSVASVVVAQQSSPRDILPPTPQKPVVSGTLTVVTPSTVPTPSVDAIAVTPHAVSGPQPSKPGVSQPASVETNAVQSPSLGQPLANAPVQSSPWDKSNAVPASAWETTTARTNAFAPPARALPDPWQSSPPPSQNWNASPPLESSGTKTEWK